MSESQEFLLILAIFVFIMLASAGLFFTFTDIDCTEKNEDQQAGANKHEHTNDHQKEPIVDYPVNVEKQANHNQRQSNESYFQRRQLNVSIGLNIITLVAAVAGLFGLYILYGTLDATKTQATIARQELEISHRPWIASVKPAQVIKPFTFHDMNGVTFALNIPIKNTGFSTAINVYPVPNVIIDDTNLTHERLVQAAKTMNCASSMIDALGNVIGGTPIPPGAEINYSVPEGVNSSTLKPDSTIQIWLYLCLAYQDVLIEPPKIHHYCVVEDFVNGHGQREFAASGSINGTFEIANGGCAD